MKNNGKGCKEGALIVFTALWLLMGVAQKAHADDDEYSFNWLDPDKKIYVLQNRKYTKANHLMLSLMVGPGLSNPYRNVFVVDPRATYYFSEAWGLEGFYTLSINNPNNTYEALTGTGTNTLPLIREIRSEVGATLHWVPWYAKINVFNTILHFDWYFALGGGVVNADVNTNGSSIVNTPESHGAVFWGTGHLYHVTQNFDVRLDFTGAIYNAAIGTPDGSTAWYSNYNFTMGFALKL